MRAAVSFILLIALGGAGLGACAEQRVVKRDGLLDNIVARTQGEGGSPNPGGLAPAGNPVFMIPEGRIRAEDEDGSVTLYAKRVKHLMTHIISTIEEEEEELFVEQVLSKITVQEFRERGLDPSLAFEELSRRRRDVYSFFGAVPMGEATPGVYLKEIGPNMFRLSVPRGRHPDLYWTGMDASFEGGNYRLRWFVR